MNDRAIDRIAIGVVVALALVVFYQALRWLVATWLSDPYYSHGFLVPAVGAWLVWRLRGDARMALERPSLWGLVALAGALLLAVVSTWQQAFFVASLAIPALIVAAILYIKGWGAASLALFPAAYLVLMVPMPFVGGVAMQLQVWTSTLSTAAARLVAVPAEQVGAAVSVPGAAYVVGIACSGLSSIVALLALGLLVAYLVKGRLWAKGLLVVLVAPIAIVANTLRVASLLWVAYRFGSEAGLAYHDTVAGFLSWAVAVALLILACRVLRCQLDLVGSS